MPEELPAWCMCSMRSMVVYLRSAVASKPIWPIIAKLGSSLAMPSSEALARMVSSWSSSSRPAMSRTGTTDFAKRPSARAAAARWCERSANASTSARCQPSSVPIRSAPTPCGTKPSLLVDARVHHPGAAVAAHRPAAHALHAAGHHQVFPAALDLGGGQVHRLQPAGAEAALRHAGHGLRPFGVQHRGARDVGALLAHRRHAAQHHVVHQRGVELRCAAASPAAACAAATPARPGAGCRPSCPCRAACGRSRR